jgi:hypothetical protein
MTKEAMLAKNHNTPISVQALYNLSNQGYKFVQVKGLNEDNKFDYIEPHHMILVPIKELPEGQDKKDIYEPITSDLLLQMANEKNSIMDVLIAEVA